MTPYSRPDGRPYFFSMSAMCAITFGSRYSAPDLERRDAVFGGAPPGVPSPGCAPPALPSLAAFAVGVVAAAPASSASFAAPLRAFLTDGDASVSGVGGPTKSGRLSRALRAMTVLEPRLKNPRPSPGKTVPVDLCTVDGVTGGYAPRANAARNCGWVSSKGVAGSARGAIGVPSAATAPLPPGIPGIAAPAPFPD